MRSLAHPVAAGTIQRACSQLNHCRFYLQVAAAVRGAGGAYLEAPVSGSKGPAEQGQLIFLSAGGGAFCRFVQQQMGRVLTASAAQR